MGCTPDALPTDDSLYDYPLRQEMFPRFLILIGPVRAGQGAADSDNSLRIWNQAMNV